MTSIRTRAGQPIIPHGSAKLLSVALGVVGLIGPSADWAGAFAIVFLGRVALYPTTMVRHCPI